MPNVPVPMEPTVS